MKDFEQGWKGMRFDVIPGKVDCWECHNTGYRIMHGAPRDGRTGQPHFDHPCECGRDPIKFLHDECVRKTEALKYCQHKERDLDGCCKECGRGLYPPERGGGQQTKATKMNEQQRQMANDQLNGRLVFEIKASGLIETALDAQKEAYERTRASMTMAERQAYACGIFPSRPTPE